MAWTIDAALDGSDIAKGLVVTLTFSDGGVPLFARYVRFYSGDKGEYIFCQPINPGPVKVADVPNIDKLVPLPVKGVSK